MKPSTSFLRQNGLSLVEVLAALVLLGIVFVGIMTIFPQMTLFNERTDAKLDTMNLARLEMQHLQEASVELTDEDDINIKALYSEPNYKDLEIELLPVGIVDRTLATHLKVKFTSNDFDFETLINLTRETVSTIEETANLDTVSLHLVTMSIFKDSQKRSETYGYIAQKEVVPIVSE
ncbi:MAG TPA: type II secretion system protein [Paenisporosarcina sp.]|nr:type II secretion system protein [Paenisporosarcina sp.]